MDFFLNLVTPLSEATGIPVVAAALISLFALGLLGHFIIRRSVQRLGVFADTTSTRWDDVVYYSISPPAEWAMWVCIVYGSLSLFEEAEALRAGLLQLADTLLILLVGWLLHRVSTGMRKSCSLSTEGLEIRMIGRLSARWLA